MSDLEVKVAVLEERLSNMEDDLHEVTKKVNEMHAILLQAKGVRWVIITAAALAGFLASYMPKFFPFVK